MILALVALFFPVCASDGIAAADPVVCVWVADANVDSPYVGGLDFIATHSQAIHLPN